MSGPGAPRRVLHVLRGLDRGGVETWLLELLRLLDRREIACDFAVHAPGPCAYDAEARRLGARLLRCPPPERPLAYAAALRAHLRDAGPYDVVHAHLHRYSGWVLRAAAAAGVPIRLAHAHNDFRGREGDAGLARRAYVALTGAWIRHYAAAGLACSTSAAADLFGPTWALDPRVHVLPYALDLAPYEVSADRSAIRRTLGIPERAHVIGHVGTLKPQKNHAFLIDAIAALAQRGSTPWLLLVGDGLLRPELTALLRSRGLARTSVLAGGRGDVPALLAAMDVFAFPSRWEGLGRALLEAQASGLPCVVSPAIPAEAVVVRPLVRREPLGDPAAWADALASALARPAPISAADARAALAASRCTLAQNLALLRRCYAA